MKIKNYIVLILIIIIIQGCPVPAFYYIVSKNGVYNDYLFNDKNLTVLMKTAHPWLFKNEKTISFRLELVNKTSELILFDIQNIELISKTEVYQLTTNFNSGVKNTKNEIDNIDSICSYQSKNIDIVFVSNKEYSKNMYFKTLEKDTLTLKMKNSAFYIELLGKDSRRLSKNK